MSWLVVLHGFARAEAPAAGDVFVTTDTPGARVFLDGVDSGLVTPTMIRGVVAGDHAVTAKSTCSVAQQTVRVPAGAIARAELRLETFPGALTVTVAPTNATMAVDGSPVGPSPWTGVDLVCGEHLVVVEAPDHVPQRHRVVVIAGETAKLDVALEIARLGTIVVDVSPFDASIRLDGKDLGQGPRTLERVSAGAHAIEATHARHPKATASFDLGADTTTRVTLALDAPKGTPRTSVTASAGVPAATAAAAPPAASEPASAAPPAPWPPAPAAASPVAAAPPPMTTAAPLAPLPMTPPVAPARVGAPAGRVVLNSAVTVAGIGAGVGAALVYMEAQAYYEEFLAVPSDSAADRIFERDVQPRQTMAIVLGATGIALLGTGGALWATTDFGAKAAAVGVAGTF